MKKALLCALGLSMAALSAEAPTIVSFDKALAIQKSAEGQDAAAKYEKERATFEKDLRDMGQKIRTKGEALEKQVKAGLLSREAYVAKQGSLAIEVRKAERFKKAREEDIEANLKIKYELVGMKFDEAARAIFTEKKAKLMIDIRTPGVLAVNPDADITNEVIKKANAKYKTSNQNTGAKA
jgi:Skp family chaperone for outer membrane proteins